MTLDQYKLITYYSQLTGLPRKAVKREYIRSNMTLKQLQQEIDAFTLKSNEVLQTPDVQPLSVSEEIPLAKE